MAAEFDQGDKMRRMEGAADDPTPALKQIGELLKSATQRSFKTQRFGKHRWAPRAVPNVYGIIADFAGDAKTPPKRRFEPRKALINTTQLRDTIGVDILGTKAVEVGSNLPYAATMNEGGPIESLPITQKVIDKLKEFLGTKSKPGPGFEWRKDLGFLLNKKFRGKTLKGKVEARPFVGLTRQIMKDVKEVVGVKIFEVS